MRTTEVITISLPPLLVREFESVCKKESRTRSELVREALRVYIESRYPAVRPTRDELVAIRRGRAAMRRGDVISWEDYLKRDMASQDRQLRQKRAPRVTKKRAIAH